MVNGKTDEDTLKIDEDILKIDKDTSWDWREKRKRQKCHLPLPQEIQTENVEYFILREIPIKDATGVVFLKKLS